LIRSKIGSCFLVLLEKKPVTEMRSTLPWNEKEARAILARHQGGAGPLLPILHDMQDRFGCVPEAAEPLIADALNLTRAEVHGVVTFYHDYRREPAGQHVIKLCRAEACQAMGADALAERVQQLLGIGFGDTSADGKVTLEPVYCLGLCACAPSAMIDGEVAGRLNVDNVSEALKERGAL